MLTWLVLGGVLLLGNLLLGMDILLVDAAPKPPPKKEEEPGASSSSQQVTVRRPDHCHFLEVPDAELVLSQVVCLSARI
jgi:hypothetical protein